MKKNIILIFGIIFLSGTILSVSLASREAYHAYLVSHNKQNTRFSEGRTSQLKQLLQKKRAKKVIGKTKIRTKNLRYSQENTRNTYISFSNNKNLKARTSTKSLKYNRSLKSHRNTVIIPKIKNQDVAVKTYENTDFSFQLPSGWKSSLEHPHTFKNIKNDFIINIKKIPTNTCNEIIGFEACAISISKNENRIEGNLLPASRIIRQSNISDNFLNRSDLWTRTFTESFSAYIPKHGDQLINRYFVEDIDHGVYLIETRSSVYKAKDNIKISKKIFDSFRIYPKD